MQPFLITEGPRGAVTAERRLLIGHPALVAHFPDQPRISRSLRAHKCKYVYPRACVFMKKKRGARALVRSFSRLESRGNRAENKGTSRKQKAPGVIYEPRGDRRAAGRSDCSLPAARRVVYTCTFAFFRVFFRARAHVCACVARRVYARIMPRAGDARLLFRAPQQQHVVWHSARVYLCARARERGVSSRLERFPIVRARARVWGGRASRRELSLLLECIVASSAEGRARIIFRGMESVCPLVGGEDFCSLYQCWRYFSRIHLR